MPSKKAKSKPPSTSSRKRKTPSRVAKSRLSERLKNDTKAVVSGTLTNTMRKQGYEEIPLQELQDRLSKLRMPLAELILSRRG